MTGIFGVAFGALEAGYYTYAVGPSGDDYTGLLSIPAGLLLVGLGVVVLWRSRRLDDRRWWRYLRRTLIAVVAAFAGLQLVAPVILGYLATHVQRAAVPVNELGVAHEDVTLTTSDGLHLEGWYIPSRNGAAIVSYPGRKGPQAHARMLARHGYGVLLFDRRGEGESEGDGNLFGWGGEKDIYAAIDFLKNRPEVDPTRIGGMGFSVGGEMMLQAAAENHDLAAVLSEGAGTRQVSEQREELHGPEFWFGSPLMVMQTASTAVFSNTMTPPKPHRRRAGHRAAQGAAHLGTQRRQPRDHDAEVREADRAERLGLGDAHGQAHHGHQGPAGRVRAPGRRLLRRRRCRDDLRLPPRP